MNRISLASVLGENLIINPSWQKFERGVLLSGITASQYIADRYQMNLSNSSGWDLTYQDLSSHGDGTPLPPDAISDTHGRIRNNIAVATGAISATNYTLMHQRIEGLNAVKVFNKNSVFKNRVRTNKAGIYTFFAANAAFTRTYVTEVSLLADTWTDVVIKIPKIDTSIGVWDAGADTGISVGFVLMSGTTNHRAGALDTWEGDGKWVSPNQVNFGEDVDNRFYTTEWQYHEGIEEKLYLDLLRDPGTEGELCRRYYEAIDPFKFCNATFPSQQPFQTVTFLTEKRAIPTMGGLVGVIEFNITGTSVAASNIGKKTVTVQMNGTDGNQNQCRAQINALTASAEL